MAIEEYEIAENAIENVLDEETDKEFQAQPEHFKIDSLDKLDWAVRKWKKVDSDMQAKIECAQRQILKLQAYMRDVKDRADKNKVALESMMRPFVEQQLAGGKTKTIPLPSGKVGLRKQHPIIEKDDEKLVKFLHESKREDLIEIREIPKWVEFKKELKLVTVDGVPNYVTSDGEIVPLAVAAVADKIVVESN